MKPHGTHVCPRCGEKRHGTGFRFFIRGIGYCNKCWALFPKQPTWLIGPSYYFAGTAFVESA